MNTSIVPVDESLLHEQWFLFVRDFAPWKSFITLTFKDIVTRDQSEHAFRFLVQYLNQKLYGNHYTRIVGHCYFSYVVGFEYQKRGALHMHVLVDKPVDFSAIHSLWCGLDKSKPRFGFAWIQPVNDLVGMARYMVKYVVKDGDLWMWKQKKFKLPAFVPMWLSSNL